ncbi:hypothetical protein SprV_0200636700 [Sparganum proliferum]
MPGSRHLRADRGLQTSVDAVETTKQETTPLRSTSQAARFTVYISAINWPKVLEYLPAPDANDPMETRWCQLPDAVHSTAVGVLGRAHHQNQDWFGENKAAISNLLSEKNRFHRPYVGCPTDVNKTTFYPCRRLAQQQLRELQDAWMALKVEEIQGSTDPKQTKSFFIVIKAIYSPPTKEIPPILSSDVSTFLTEMLQISKHWAERFRSVLNHSSTIDRLPRMEIKIDLGFPPSLPGTICALQQLSGGKAPGSDAFSVEIYRHDGHRLMDQVTTLIQELWSCGQVPWYFKDATIVHLYKLKENQQLCGNHRGIQLHNIGGNIFGRILLKRVSGHLEEGLLSENQCGFRRHRLTSA